MADETKTEYEKLKEKYALISQANDRMKEYLKKLDITLENLPPKQHDLLSHYARAKKETELHALETSYFEEWFLLRCEKKYADMEIIHDLQLTVSKYTEELDDDNKKIVVMEEFLNDSSIKPADQSENELVMVEQKLAGAAQNYEEIVKQEPPYCLDALIEKILELEKE